jgi:phosphoribosylformylglycinamidine (FGAM) synthase PurS component
MLIAFIFLPNTAAIAATKSNTDSLYKVNKINVDVTSKSSSTARKLAMKIANQKAFNTVINRITLKEDKSKIPEPSEKELSALVRDVAILSEKVSSVRYIAEVSVNLKPEAIKEFLTKNGVAIAETNGAPVLVVPLFKPSPNADVILWESENEWRQTWERLKETGTSLILKQTPFGDLQDIQTLNPSDIENLNFVAMDKMASRYGVNDIYIVAAELRETPEEGKNLLVTIVQKSDTGAKKWPAFKISAIDPETHKELPLKELFKRAAQSTSNIIDNNWKKKSAIRFDEESKLLAIVNLTKLNDWVQVKDFLDKSKLIDRYDLQAIKKNKAQVLINFSGGLHRLQTAMKQNNIRLEIQAGIGVITPNIDASMIKNMQQSLDTELGEDVEKALDEVDNDNYEEIKAKKYYEQQQHKSYQQQQDFYTLPVNGQQRIPANNKATQSKENIDSTHSYNHHSTNNNKSAAPNYQQQQDFYTIPVQQQAPTYDPQPRYYRSIPASNLQPVEN